jgi:hypothetical protein
MLYTVMYRSAGGVHIYGPIWLYLLCGRYTALASGHRNADALVNEDEVNVRIPSCSLTMNHIVVSIILRVVSTIHIIAATW